MKHGMSMLVLVFLVGTSTALAQNDSFLCVAESAVGFDFNKSTKEWERANFKSEGKYVLSKSTDKGKGWKVKKIGESIGAECSEGFNEHDFIDCNGLRDFQMNRISLRYIIVHKYGYVVKEYSNDGLFDEGSMTPYLEIGKCSPF